MTHVTGKHERFSLAVICLAAVTIWSQAAQAEVTYTESGDKDSTTIIRMTLTPAAEPVPALKYRFEARDIELEPGNAVTYYHARSRKSVASSRGP